MTESLYQYMDTVGDGSGTDNFVGNYSGAVEQALLTPPQGKFYKVARLIISVEDTNGFTAENYGDLLSPLTNGIEIKKYNRFDEVTLNLTDGIPVKSNAGWGTLCYDAELKSWGATNDFLVVRFTFEKAGRPLFLSGDAGDYLAVELNDDLTGLISHRFMAQGIKYD